MRCPRLVLCVAILVSTCLIAQETALAVTFNVPVTLQTAPGYTNEVALTVGGTAGSPASNVATGDYTVQLDVSFDPAEAATINSIRFVSSAGGTTPDKPGHIKLGSMTFYDGAVSFSDMWGTFSTPGDAIAVTGGTFATTSDSETTGNRVLINGGIIDATVVDPEAYFDLSSDWPINQPINSASGATGTISVSAPYLSGGVKTYEVSVAVPMLFSQKLTAVSEDRAEASGTLYGTGSFAVPEPSAVAMLIAGALGLLGWAGLRRR